MKHKRRSGKVKARKTSISSLAELEDYEPSHFLCCHSIIEGEGRKKTKVWNCAFEPSLSHPGKTGNILATCGGNTVCFIDVDTGKVMKRFKDTDLEENFYTVAWTALQSEEKKFKILAVAGVLGVIKLIYPEQLVCYDMFPAHRKYINCLVFHPKSPNLMFSGSGDGFIMLWDISLPGSISLHNHSPLLKLRTVDIGDPLNMVFNDQMGTLLSVTERGCFGWSLGKLGATPAPKKQRNVITQPSCSFCHGNSDKAVDSLVSLEHGLVATKQVESGEILVWDMAQHIRSALGSKKDISIEPQLRLEFPDRVTEYLYMGYNNGLLAAGDGNGSMYLYNLTEALDSLPVSSSKPLKASRVLEWPIIENQEEWMEDETVVLNSVALSSDHRVVAGGTDNNLVCLWRQTDSCE